MLNKTIRFLILTLAIISFTVSYSFAQMSSANYTIFSSVMNTAGDLKDSNGFDLLDSIGQSTPIGLFSSNNFQLEAGFLYQTQFTMPLDDAISNAIDGLEDILNDPDIDLTKQEKKKINMAIQFLQQAMDAYAQYEAGDTAALANALNKTKSAINKMIASGVVDTVVYQKMLAQAAELAVTSEINRIASIAGDTDPNVVQARVFLSDGSAELLNAVYNDAVQSFTQAYNEALLAV